MNIKNNTIKKNFVWIYGKHPVFAVLLEKRREIYQILVTRNSEVELKNFIKEHKISISHNLIKLTDGNNINKNLPDFATHQGFAIKTSPINLLSENQFLDKTNNIKPEELPNLLILDQLTDPHNIGAIIRSAVAFGIKDIAVCAKTFPAQSAIIAKSSSGMVEMVDLISVNNINNFLHLLKKVGYWSVGLDGEAKVTISKIKDYQPVALVIGSEGVGIRKLVKSNCDVLAKIPMSQKVESLNASNAAAIAMYEIFK
jgi:23S rRNA (guanosine2251-2'-O)-methyltransferase